MAAEPEVVRARSPAMCRFFAAVMAREMRRGFHKVRLARPGLPALPPGCPLVVYSNHPSWWDPAFFIVLATRLFPDREGYGPMEAEALDRYRFMRRIGIFGIEPDTARGAAEFMRVGTAVLSDPRRMLWVTAQGRFSDPRARPVALRPGVARLMERVPGTIALPLALEYPFWTEKRPEALARFGAPVQDADRLEEALLDAMDWLAADAATRDPSAFDELLRGRVGIGGAYDVWRRAAAALRGERFRAEHGVEER
jgi:1-acyl-sn-glycerol-3-phosphate acyltransferase